MEQFLIIDFLQILVVVIITSSLWELFVSALYYVINLLY